MLLALRHRANWLSNVRYQHEILSECPQLFSLHVVVFSVSGYNENYIVAFNLYTMGL